jgi:hypothetical protein
LAAFDSERGGTAKAVLIRVPLFAVIVKKQPVRLLPATANKERYGYGRILDVTVSQHDGGSADGSL